MPKYSQTSRTRLNTCHPDLQRLFNEVIKYYDCTIACGHRGEAEQNKAFDEGKSKKRYPDSKHNQYPSEAVDAYVYPVIFPSKSSKNYIKEVARYYYFAGFVKAIAIKMDIPVRWGGDWDGDYDIFDQTFDDLAHFELKEGR